MKTMRELENELFENWKNNRAGLVRDGVVCEEEFSKSELKIILILKEVNNTDGSLRDLRTFMEEGGRAQTWNTVTRWLQCIRNIDQDVPWNALKNIDADDRKRELRSVGSMNLKKSPGTHTTNAASLKAVANEDAENIRQQYALYDPDITICGGTGWLFKRVAGHNDIEVQETSGGVQWYERAPKKYVLFYYHPAARISGSMLSYSLVDAVKEIVGK